jgi:hypothetical protein
MTHIEKPNSTDNELRHSLLSGEAIYGYPGDIIPLAVLNRRKC